MKKHLLNLRYFGLFLVFLFSGISSVQAAITTQPKSVTVCSGTASIGFSIKTDYLLPSYQWQGFSGKSWINLTDGTDLYTGITISGSKTTSLGFTFPKGGVRTDWSGSQVRCIVTVKLINYTSSTAVATVVAAPVINTSPASIDKVVGQSASFSISATGTGLSYQWQIDQGSGYVNIAGATTSAFSIISVATKDAGTYRCMVTNGICTAKYSAGAVLGVFPVLTIDKNPGKASACPSGTAKFSVVASNATAYQWEVLPYKDVIWKPISGANESSYTTGALSSGDDESRFRCVVSGGAGQQLTSYEAILYVYSLVSGVSTPSGATKIVGESVTFNVTAYGHITSYQWKRDNVNIAGANSSSYTIPVLATSHAGSYTCVVSGCNSVTSGAAVLIVNEPSYPNGWYKQTSGSGLNIYDISAVSENVAWAITSDQNKVLYTINGGTNWASMLTDYNGYWRSIYFTSATTGMVGGQNGITRTTNSGTNWAYTDWKTNFGIDPGSWFYIYNFHFLNASTGWFVGTGGIIAKTADGGATWTKVSFKNDASPVTDVDLYSVYVADANTVYVSGASGKMFKTINGGANWSELSTGTNGTIQDMAFTSVTTGYFVTNGVYKGIFTTVNGGSTWTQVNVANINANIYPVSVDFTDANNGWAAGYIWDGVQKPAIMKTYDGGAHWVTQKITDIGSLNKIRMFNSDHGWVSGSGGIIQRTGKGGCYTPAVSLYADQVLCANQSYQLVADTFANNYNSRYSWSTGVNTGKITVNTTANYSVTITNECGVTASDNATITFNPLPVVSAGDDVAICAGESAQLLATGGTGYLWNNAGYLNDPAISNPIATPPAGANTFTVTVTDTNGCINTDAVKVTVNAIPASDFTAPEFVCGTANGSFSYVGSATGKSFAWTFSEGNPSSATGSGPVNSNWNSLGDKIVSLTVTQNNCESQPTLKIVNVREKPTSTFVAPAATCGTDAAVLFYTGSAPTEAGYNWSLDGGVITSGSGQGPIQVSWETPGTKAVSLSVTQNECLSDVSDATVVAAYPFEGEEICLVTIDLETGKNMVVWEKTHGVGIASYNVYREGNIQNNYDLIGIVPFNEISIFVDGESKPEQQQYKYKISAVDTCGNESALSKWHKTMFLQYVSSDNGVNLNWQEYGVENGSMSFNSYAIFRGSDSTALTELATISASFLAYTDGTPSALSQKMYYRVGGVKANACDPAEIGGKKASSGPFVHSLSNLEDNRLQGTGVSNVNADALRLSVYPSPFTNLATISYSLQKPSKMKVEVYNVVGEKIAMILDETQSAGNHKLELKAEDVHFISGLYYLRIMVDNTVIVRKTMLSR